MPSRPQVAVAQVALPGDVVRILNDVGYLGGPIARHACFHAGRGQLLQCPCIDVVGGNCERPSQPPIDPDRHDGTDDGAVLQIHQRTRRFQQRQVIDSRIQHFPRRSQRRPHLLGRIAQPDDRAIAGPQNLVAFDHAIECVAQHLALNLARSFDQNRVNRRVLLPAIHMHTALLRRQRIMRGWFFFDLHARS